MILLMKNLIISKRDQHANSYWICAHLRARYSLPLSLSILLLSPFPRNYRGVTLKHLKRKEQTGN